MQCRRRSRMIGEGAVGGAGGEQQEEQQYEQE